MDLDETEVVDVDQNVGNLSNIASGLPDEGSLLDQLTEARKELSERRTVDVPVLGYENSGISLFARYRLLDGPEISKIGRKVQREFKDDYRRSLYAALDVFIAACEGFFIDKGDGEHVPLTYNHEPIMGYNEQLAQAFKMAVDPMAPARSIVLQLFGNNEIAVQTHNLMLGRWMSNTSIEVTGEFFEGNL